MSRPMSQPTDPPSFDAAERALLAALADALIPAGGAMPSASQAGAAGEGLDRVLRARPDLVPALKAALASARRLYREMPGAGVPAERMAALLREKDPAGFGVLAELVPAAYFMSREVLERIGYSGQSPRPIEPDPPDLLEGLLRPVRERGPIYRPTPPTFT